MRNGAKLRSSAPKEKQKLDAILKSYRGLIPTPMATTMGLDSYYGWRALQTGLDNIARWADAAERHYASLSKRRAADLSI